MQEEHRLKSVVSVVLIKKSSSFIYILDMANSSEPNMETVKLPLQYRLVP
jgi:hypothetical protein